MRRPPDVLHNRWLAALIVTVAAVLYPVAVVAHGGPHFPSVRECSVPATHDGNIELVLGTFDSVAHADALLARVRKRGYTHARVELAACGQIKVAQPGYPTLAGVRDAIAEARRRGVTATAEFASGTGG
jgi:hypothetical protein